MPKHYDAIVVGTGQAGPSLAGRLNEAGTHTAVIGHQKVGGTCVNVGCIPTKTLVGVPGWLIWPATRMYSV